MIASNVKNGVSEENECCGRHPLRHVRLLLKMLAVYPNEVKRWYSCETTIAIKEVLRNKQFYLEYFRHYVEPLNDCQNVTRVIFQPPTGNRSISMET